MAPGGNIGRLIARLGTEIAGRIDILPALSPEAFYAAVDVALTPQRGFSPRMAAEALACGVPPVALTGGGLAEPYGSFLRDHGLGSLLVAADDHEYVNIAVGLASSSAHRERLQQMIASSSTQNGHPVRIAQTIETQAWAHLTESAL
jgi:predicted O-linked N-acetylglucosamine transferase (SPINDLY family)